MLTTYPKNPYYNMAAIRSSDMFFGRTNLLTAFYHALTNRQSISLVGIRSIGKSSFLYYASLPEIQARFPVDLSHHIFVLLDLREHIYKTNEEFFHDVSKEIKRRGQRFDNLSLHSEGQGHDEFSNLLDQINDQGFYPVLLMDAFDNITLNTQFGPEFFAFLRAHATFGKISYVTASIASLYDLIPRHYADSSFFSIFYSFSVGALTEEETSNLISLPADRAGMPFTQKEVAWVRKEAGLHPFFIQRICYALFEEKQQSPNGEVDLMVVRKKAFQSLLDHFTDTWQHLTEAERASLQDEAQQKDHQHLVLPELSESAFFRQFVRKTQTIRLFQMSVDELEEALSKMNDPIALGGTNLRLLKAVTRRLNDEIPPTVAEKGKIIREVLNEALERLRGSGIRSDMAPDWMYYNILYYRYFRLHLNNSRISERLGSGVRQYYRARIKAIEALRNILLEME